MGRTFGEIAGRLGAPLLTYPRHGARPGWRLEARLAVCAGGPGGWIAGHRPCFNRRDSRNIRRRPGSAISVAIAGPADLVRRDRLAKPAGPRRLSVQQRLPRARDPLPGEPAPPGALVRPCARAPDVERR